MQTLLTLSAMTAAALGIAWACWSFKVTIWPDRVESDNGFYTRRLQRSDIEGYLANARNGRVMLVGRESWHPSVTIPRSFMSDPRSRSWFADIPSLTRRHSQAVMNDARLGETADARRQKLGELQEIAKMLDWLGYGIGLWVLFWPQPYTIAILCAVAAPPVALAINTFSRQMLSLSDETSGDPRPRIQMLFLMPALVLALRALLDINLLDWQPALICSLLPAALLAVPIFKGDAQFRQRPFLGMFMAVVAFAYSWGGISEIDYIFDTSPPRVFRTTIRSLHVSHGKSTSYHLVFDAWNGRPAGDDVQVRYAFFAHRHVGEDICVHLWDGWLGFRYIDAATCE